MPAATRPASPSRTPARERILDTACRLFYAHGTRGVGIDTVIAESGVAKATLYVHFPSKDELVLAYLQRADTAWREALREAATAAGTEPRDQLVGMFDGLAAACRAQGFRGCSFINTAAEVEPGTRVHAVVVAHKEAVRDWVAGIATRGGATAPRTLARSLCMVLDGALAAGRVSGAAESAHAAKRIATLLVDAALPPGE